MNNIQLIGNLARAVELRDLGGGKVLGKSILAVSRTSRGVRVGTEWIPVVLWDRQAQNAARYLTKGSRVAVQGRLRGDYVQGKGSDGETKRSRLALEVVVDRITYLSPMRRPGDASTEEAAPDGGRSGR